MFICIDFKLIFNCLTYSLRCTSAFILMIFHHSCIPQPTSLAYYKEPEIHSSTPFVSSQGNRGAEGWVFVTKVIDGDTFWVKDSQEHSFKVRFIGIDAPEVQNRGKKKKGPFAKEATEFVRQLTEGKKVLLVADIQKFDRYGRFLAYVYLPEGTFLNVKLVEEGYAVVSTFPPNVEHSQVLIEAQRLARKNSRGLWGVKIR
jgi:endonuclease YncB( thermonuclease family)